MTLTSPARKLARIALYCFLLTFIAARIIVYLIMARDMPDLYMYVGGTHVHHLNYGIFLLSVVGAYLLLAPPAEKARKYAAAAYGVGMALTFDEFGMWLHLGGGYWQRASFDAVIVVAAVLALLAFAPSFFALFRRRHLVHTTVAVLSVCVFFALLARARQFAAHSIAPRLHSLERRAPQ